ncbi:uncharacterized protein LOC118436732 [Folsomia candida]|uniref:uncharacterized protein LOC118436732 n=1 Tax=Folsomia candida TaxID=158441 RepID=UPI0016051C8C|nr:uncharacterized protein LOC118436732 [Folsomia candida]
MAVNLIEPPDGVFQAKSNTGSDDWSVILPYIDRRKYTIGDKYISWATQGDFVFFRTKGDQWNWRFGLEILCDDDFYWVKPGQGDIIFQNGVKLDDKVETRLNFNDTLIVTKLRNNISGGLAIFTFNKREYPENWDTCKKMELCGSEKAPESSFTLDRNQLVCKIP